MKVLIGINNLTVVDQMAYANHIQFFYNLGKLNGDKHEFLFCNPRRMSIDRMRNFCAKVCMEQEADYLMFIDDDVLVPKAAFNTLVDHLEKDRADIVSGVTLIRGYPYHPMIFDFGRKENHFVDNYEELQDPETHLVKCDAVGFSTVMMKVSLLRQLTPPYFITGERHTEDVYFCQKAKRQVPEVKIFADASVVTGHLLNPEAIGPYNKKLRKVYDETENPELLDAENRANREFRAQADRDDRDYTRLGIDTRPKALGVANAETGPNSKVTLILTVSRPLSRTCFLTFVKSSQSNQTQPSRLSFCIRLSIFKKYFMLGFFKKCTGSYILMASLFSHILNLSSVLRTISRTIKAIEISGKRQSLAARSMNVTCMWL